MIDAPGTLDYLQMMRRYFDSGDTRSYTFRRQQLLTLRKALLANESAINAALYSDLKKSPEETYATETGLVLAELSVALKNLHRWMKPRRTAVNRVNLPSSGKIYRDPLGVVLIISAWNYPLQLLLIPLVSAIAAGNCAVLKPSEAAPATAAVIEQLITGYFPESYLHVVQGDGAIVVPEAMARFRFDHVFYTGSIGVGKSIYQLAAKDLVPVTLELGGKSPAVVEADADLTTTAKRIAVGKFSNAGQTCVAPDYVLVHADIKDKLVTALKEAVSQFYGTDASRNYNYGRIINGKRFDKVLEYLSQGDVVMGGQHDRAELFLAPTLIENVSPSATLMTEEIFGPVLPIFTYQHMEDALALIRRNPNPLAFYLFTSDTKKEKAWMEQLAFGGGCINNTLWHFANHYLPFGGIGNSGIGAYHGRYGFETFSHAKPVMKTPVWFDPSIKYPPFKGKLKWFKLFIR